MFEVLLPKRDKKNFEKKIDKEKRCRFIKTCIQKLTTTALIFTDNYLIMQQKVLNHILL